MACRVGPAPVNSSGASRVDSLAGPAPPAALAWAFATPAVSLALLAYSLCAQPWPRLVVRFGAQRACWHQMPVMHTPCHPCRVRYASCGAQVRPWPGVALYRRALRPSPTAPQFPAPARSVRRCSGATPPTLPRLTITHHHLAHFKSTHTLTLSCHATTLVAPAQQRYPLRTLARAPRIATAAGATSAAWLRALLMGLRHVPQRYTMCVQH